jgi:pantetheine-phosphate adenylyltransferase
MRHKLVALGGTFDRFHKGHETLLKKAFEVGEKVVIGVTDPSMTVSKPFAISMQPYKDRKNNVFGFLKKNNLLARSKITRLNNPYGPLKHTSTIKAVVVGSYYNKAVVRELEKRYAIIHSKIVYADDGKLLSSSRIRSGEIDRNGKAYVLPKHDMTLPLQLRKTLKKPLGALFLKPKKPKLLLTVSDAPLVVSVGDITTQTLLSLGIIPHVSVVDFCVQRKKQFNSVHDLGFLQKHVVKTVSVRNPAGSITKELFTAVFTSVKDYLEHKTKTVIIVEGEDDLATLAALYKAPLNSVILYGQPPQNAQKEGMVNIVVTEDNKNFARQLLARFESI